MNQTPFYDEQDYQETASIPRGGCFSLVLAPLIIAFLLTAFSQMLRGETTRPWDMAFIISESPASAHSLSIQAAPQPSPTPPHQAGIADFFMPSVQFWEADILRWADQNGLDPDLIATVMQIESCGDPRALSSAGAMGLFQVMPYHFDPSEAPYDPDTNARRGMGYLSESMGTHQDFRLAMAGYNGGIRTASKPEHQWPQETIRYAYWGSGIYQEALSGEETSLRLAEWLQAGGASLCRQAEQRLGIAP